MLVQRHMRSLFIGSGIMLILIISMTAGCTTNPDIPGNPPSQTLPPVAGTPALPASGEHPADTGICPPVPPLVIDNNQPMTSVPHGFGFGDNTMTYNLPAGSIIFHTPEGITRVFDRNGTQILVANDSETQVPTPGGFEPSTNVLEVPGGAFVQADGNMTHITLNGTCIATTVSSDTPPAPSGRVCHCPMRPVQSVTTTTTAFSDDGLCHCT
jgi:hypothetical protein